MKKRAKERSPEEATWEESDEIVELDVKRPLDKVIPVRLPADKWEALRSQAQALGVGPTTLARMWILSKLQGTQRLLSEEEARELMLSVLQQAKEQPGVPPRGAGRRTRTAKRRP